MHQVSVLNAEGPPVPIPNTEVKLRSAENTYPATDRKNRSMLTSIAGLRPAVGDPYAEGPPVPIPNTVVKLRSAENTYPATDREDRSLPTFYTEELGAQSARRGLSV